MTVRRLRPADESTVRSLQTHLRYADPEVVTAALDGPFVGLVALEHDADGESEVVGYAVALPGHRTTLSELVVAPNRRRRGHGRALLEAVLEVASDTGPDDVAAELVVTTPADATGAREFYEANGFAVTERLSGFYADGTDALRLVRRE